MLATPNGIGNLCRLEATGSGSGLSTGEIPLLMDYNSVGASWIIYQISQLFPSLGGKVVRLGGTVVKCNDVNHKYK